MNILVTGGAGFIGSNFLNLMVPRHPEHHFINVDKLTYAANLENLAGIADRKPVHPMGRRRTAGMRRGSAGAQDDFVAERRRASLSRMTSVMSSAARISNGPTLTPGCFDMSRTA